MNQRMKHEQVRKKERNTYIRRFTPLLSSIQPEAEALDFQPHALPRTL